MRKINRLLDNKDFTIVLNKGKKVKAGSYLIAVRPNEEDHVRVGISVSKKVGKAFIRVRVRRQIRAMIGKMDILDRKADIVIIPKASFLENSFEQNLIVLQEAVKRLLDGSGK